MSDKINLADLDSNLIADLDGETAGWEAREYAYDAATTTNQLWHVVYSPEIGRGGIVLVGSGSNGMTAWTDAASADDVLRRHLAGEMEG